MPPRRRTPKDTPAKLAARMSRRWRVILLRGKGQLLGEVEVSDEKAAEAAVAAQFQLNDEQRKRVAVQEVGANDVAKAQLESAWKQWLASAKLRED
jgi:hypothetical protein